MRKIFYISLIVLISQLNIKSQDFHFSQFNETPDLINPALVGSSQVMRASLIYRDQWRSVTTPFTTYGFAFETKFKASNWDPVDPRRSMTFKKSTSKLSGGISVYNDKAGDSKMGTLQSNLSLSMLFPFSKYSSLSLGLQGSLTQRKFDNNLIYPSQYNGSSYDPTLNSGEAYSYQNFSYPEVSAGGVYTYGHDEKAIAANNQVKAQIGLAVFHINRPIQNFSGSNIRLYQKYVFHGNILVGIPNSVVAIAPTWLLQLQGPSKEIIIGMATKYYINADSKYTGIHRRSSVGFGFYYRNYDAFIASLLIEKDRFNIAFSYDLNISGLSKASKGIGGFEICLRFVTPNAYLYQKRK
jgi:type IX secretion system PorP/SprF family membrane protein